jgi:hypothetical protein
VGLNSGLPANEPLPQGSIRPLGGQRNKLNC